MRRTRPYFNTRQAAAVQPAGKDAQAKAANLLDTLDTGDLKDLPDDLQKLLQSLVAQAQAGSAPAKTDAEKPDAASMATAEKTLAVLSPAGRQKAAGRVTDPGQRLARLGRGRPWRPWKTALSAEPLDGKNLVADGAKADATADGTTALVVSGLTPQQLTAIMKQIKDGDATAATAAAGNALAAQITLIQIAPVAAKKDAVPAAKIASPDAGGLRSAEKPDGDSLGQTG